MSLEHPMTVTIFPLLVDKEVRLKDILSPTQWDQINEKGELESDEIMFGVLLQKRCFPVMYLYFLFLLDFSKNRSRGLHVNP